MEVKLDKRYPVAATLEQAWAVLSDIHATAACMPGAQITEQIDDTHYKGTVRSKVGPAVMTFNGDIELQGIDAAALPGCLAGGFADSELLRRIWPQMQQRRFEPPAGYARQLLKDMKAVQAFAAGLGAELPVVAAAAARYAQFVAEGNEMADSAAILRLYRPDA